MPKRYFKLSDDMTVRGRWLLGPPSDRQGQEVENPWIFHKGRPVPNPGPLLLPVDVPGRPLDFSLAGFGTPVVHVKVASLFSELAPEDVQTVPVEISGQPEQFCILVATRLIRCIDEQASEEIQKWAPEDGQPEKVGEYRDIWGMRIAPAAVGDAQVFRPWGWNIALIVREEIKDALERMGATGTKFQEV